MTEFWNWLVIILVVVNMVACYWLIRWTAKQGDDSRAPEDTLDHVWDGDLRERNQPMPRWWLMLFYISILFGFAYLLLYPGLGNFAGTLGWSQAGQHAAEVDAVESKYQSLYAGLAGQEWKTMTADSEAMAIGDLIAVMAQGRIEQVATPEGCTTDPQTCSLPGSSVRCR